MVVLTEISFLFWTVCDCMMGPLTCAAVKSFVLLTDTSTSMYHHILVALLSCSEAKVKYFVFYLSLQTQLILTKSRISVVLLRTDHD